MSHDPGPHQIMAEQGHVLSVTCDEDGPGEGAKYTYTVRLPNGQERAVPWTPWPWHQMTRDDFRRWIRLGYPGRQGVGPLDSKQLEAMEKAAA
jgi:hypothetical protein